MLAVLSGDRPSKPENAEAIGMTDAVLSLLEECWKEDRSMRPDISNILGRFCAITEERITTDLVDVVMPQSDNGTRNSVTLGLQL